jgi:hypothetical protein
MQNRRNTNAKRSRRYQKRIRKINRNISYQFSSKIQTLGIGSTSVKVTRFYTYKPTEGYGDFVSYIMTDSVSSPEFTRIASDYNYCKLKLIVITISPRTQQTDSMNFFKVDWNNPTAIDVRYDDNSKLIYTNVTYPKIYKFEPPNILLPSGVSNYNFREWQRTNIANQSLYGFLKVTSAVEFTFQVDTKWTFRGLSSTAPTNRIKIERPLNIHNDIIDETIFDLKKIAHKLDKIEDDEEEEEEEKETKENKKKKNKNKV